MTFSMPIQNRKRPGYDPGLDGPFVWEPTLADRRQAQENHYQTLERLAERGGMSWCEMAAIVLNRRHRKLEQPYAKAVCRDVLIMRERAAASATAEATGSACEATPDVEVGPGSIPNPSPLLLRQNPLEGEEQDQGASLVSTDMSASAPNAGSEGP